MAASQQLTKIFAIAGLDIEAISSKSLFSFGYQSDGIIIGNKMYLQQ
jgi:hypothetical protein